jgi:hypothetical protein
MEKTRKASATGSRDSCILPAPLNTGRGVFENYEHSGPKKNAILKFFTRTESHGMHKIYVQAEGLDKHNGAFANF